MTLSLRFGNSSVQRRFDRLANTPNMIGKAGLHRGDDSVGIMDAAEIVMHDVWRNGGQWVGLKIT
jgi:hypothetical protein